MAKERVSALAKQVGKTSKELIEWLNNNGEYVKTPSSTIEAPVVAKVLAAFPKVEAGADGAASDGGAAPKAKKTAAAGEKGETARKQLRTVIDRLQNVLNSMQGVTDFNKLRSQAQTIKDKEDASTRALYWAVPTYWIFFSRFSPFLRMWSNESRCQKGPALFTCRLIRKDERPFNSPMTFVSDTVSRV